MTYTHTHTHTGKKAVHAMKIKQYFTAQIKNTHTHTHTHTQ